MDFYFDFVSPYGWIGAERIGPIATRHGRRIRWCPFLLKATVVDAMGAAPLLDTPLKGPYVLRDFERSLRYHDLPLANGVRLVFSPVPASRIVLWARETTPDRTGALVLALYRAHWSRGLDISSTQNVLSVVDDLGLDPDRARDALATSELKAAPRAETQRAIDAGVFGSPTTVIDGEPFWGSDRLTMVEDWLRRGGW